MALNHQVEVRILTPEPNIFPRWGRGPTRNLVTVEITGSNPVRGARIWERRSRFRTVGGGVGWWLRRQIGCVAQWERRCFASTRLQVRVLSYPPDEPFVGTGDIQNPHASLAQW